MILLRKNQKSINFWIIKLDQTKNFEIREQQNGKRENKMQRNIQNNF
jgi:hypothetical protein